MRNRTKIIEHLVGEAAARAVTISSATVGGLLLTAIREAHRRRTPAKGKSTVD